MVRALAERPLDSGAPHGRRFAGAVAVTLTLLGVAASLGSGFGSDSLVAASTITVEVLPGLSGSTNGVAYDVNNYGDIVGGILVGSSLRPVLWPAAGSPVDLGVPPGITGGIARSITDNAYIVGSTGYGTDGSYGTPIMFRPGAPVVLPGLLAGRPANAWAVNSSGVTVGEARNNTLSRTFEAAVRWENGTVQDLGKLPAWSLAQARGINDNGDIVGVGREVQWVGFSVAFVWRNGQLTELPALGPQHGNGIAYAINNAGDIVGSSQGSDVIMHAALWRNGQVINLAGGAASEARAVNSAGDAVGYVLSNSINYAALFTGGQVIVLPEPPGALSGRTIAHGMNDLGQIVGQAINATTFQTMPILWTVGGAPPPAAPSGLTARLSSAPRAIALSWLDNANNETGVSVERSEYTGTGWTNFVEIATLPAGATSYADTSFTPTSYDYRVRAFNSVGSSAYSNTATISIVGVNPAPIAIMSATPSSGTAPLTVTFDGSGSYDLELGFVTSWAWAFGDGAVGAGVTATHVYSTPGTYTARLTVTDNGNASNTTTATIVVNAPPLPSAPAGLTATALSRSSIALRWTNGSTNQTEVRIERCRGSSCTNFTQVAAVAGSATSYTNSGLSADTTYRYRVRAVNSAGTSLYSNIAAAKTLKR
jgi:probable HAF family extracellular repeat protein